MPRQFCLSVRSYVCLSLCYRSDLEKSEVERMILKHLQGDRSYEHSNLRVSNGIYWTRCLNKRRRQAKLARYQHRSAHSTAPNPSA